MLHGVSIVCFASSYGVALACEVSRPFVRFPARHVVMMGFAAAGLLAHTAYLIYALPAILAFSWFAGCQLAAWMLVIGYVVRQLWQPRATIGLILLPTSLVLIGASGLFPGNPAVPVETVRGLWSVVHGLTLLLGILLVALGGGAAVMYLTLSNQLKHKHLPPSDLRPPSLERLYHWNQRTLYGSIALLGIGLISGILLNLRFAQDGSSVIPWNDPLVPASAFWLVWLAAVLVFNRAYRPSRSAQKIAYLTIGSLMFMCVVLMVLSFGGSRHPRHNGRSDQGQAVPASGNPKSEIRNPTEINLLVTRPKDPRAGLLAARGRSTVCRCR